MEKNRILLAAVLIFTVIWNKIPFEIAVVSASESYTVLCEIPQNETTEAATETSESETGDEIKETSQTTEPEIENETKEMNSTQTETEEEIETQKTKTVDRAAEQDNLISVLLRLLAIWIQMATIGKGLLEAISLL